MKYLAITLLIFFFGIYIGYDVEHQANVLVAQPLGGINYLPNLSLTPGSLNLSVTQSNIQKTICQSGYTKTIRPASSYTTALKVKQLKSGYNAGSDMITSHYEEDHLISLELGGNPTDEKNSWPESYLSQPYNAKIKDMIENYLHKQVCSGQMKLKEVQDGILKDWTQYVKDISNTDD